MFLHGMEIPMIRSRHCNRGKMEDDMNNLSEQYLLTTSIAEQLYWEMAAELPIIDYHNHLSVPDLMGNRRFENITQLWVANDPYKHRAMRILGVPEELITGNASDEDKFRAWCRVYPKLVGNPLYDWSGMELKKIFGIDLSISDENTEKIWKEANEKLCLPEYTAGGLVNQFQSEYLAPCTSIVDSVDVFMNTPNLAPSLRGDDMMLPTPDFLRKLSEASGIKITDYFSYQEAIIKCLDVFHAVGCRFADHALDNGFEFIDEFPSTDCICNILAGKEFPDTDRRKFFSEMINFLAIEYAKRGWVLQLHIGAERFTSSKLRHMVGPAGGFSGIGNTVNIQSLVKLLDHLEQAQGELPKTILYNMNPADNASFAVMSGSFRGVTQGPAWWWCDHLHGMREMLEVFNCFSVLWSFVGMTTDSRSILSLLRHDYFRRMLCGWIGEKVVRGELPESADTLKPLIYDMCYGNARQLIIK